MKIDSEKGFVRDQMNECYSCVYKRNVPGNCHIACSNPDRTVTGDPYGRAQGWFFYPLCFDPAWKTSFCSNYRSANEEV